MGIVLFGALLFFFFPFIGAYRWYRGERHTIEDFSVSFILAFVSPSARCSLLSEPGFPARIWLLAFGSPHTNNHPKSSLWPHRVSRFA